MRSTGTARLYTSAEFDAFTAMADALYDTFTAMADALHQTAEMNRTGVVRSGPHHPYVALAKDLALFGVDRVKLAQMCANASGGNPDHFLAEIIDGVTLNGV